MGWRGCGSGLAPALRVPTLPHPSQAFVEVLISHLLMIPAPRHPHMYYTCVLIDLCKILTAVPTSAEHMAHSHAMHRPLTAVPLRPRTWRTPTPRTAPSVHC